LGVPWNMLPHPSGGTFHDQGLILNEGMSEEKAMANITEYMSFVLPRATVALDLDAKEKFRITSTTEVLDASIMSISPNPVATSVKIETEGDIIESIAIFGMDGKLYNEMSDINATSITVQRNNLPSGIYFVKAYFAEGVATQRVVFK